MSYRPIAEKQLASLLSALSQEDTFVFLESIRPDRENRYSYIFTRPQEQITLRAGEQTAPFFKAAERVLNAGLYLAGWSAYELGYNMEANLQRLQNAAPCEIICQYGAFRKALRFDHQREQFDSALPEYLQRASLAPQQEFHIKNIRPNQDREDFLTKIARIKGYIQAGDTYQVNYTLKLFFDFLGEEEALYQTLRRSQPVAYGAYMRLGGKTVMSFSPELFFRKERERCTVRPMKGTAKRGATLQEDRQAADDLGDDPKNRSENVMIVDLLRNDLGRLSKRGSVKTQKLFEVETYRTLHQMTSTISSKLRPDVGVAELFGAIFPCGSVTGAPKIRTMEIIRELELEPRGVYTGAIGLITPEMDMVFNVPIRTISLKNGRGEMGIGAGITYDSNPEHEWQECLLKGQFLTNPAPKFHLIETIFWGVDEGLFLLEEHLARLGDSAAYFQIDYAKNALQKELRQLADELKEGGETAAKIRVCLNSDGTTQITSSPWTTPKERALPVRSMEAKRRTLKISQTLVKRNSCWLYHKTSRRGLYNDERRLAEEEGFYEVIFQNERKEITEGSIANLIIKTGGIYLTPPIECGLLPGTMRAFLLKKYPQLLKERVLSLKDLQKAEAIYMCNSLRGLVRVSLNDGSECG